MSVEFQPANKLIALAIFEIGSFRKTTQSGAELIATTWSGSEKNAYASDSSCISDAFDHAGQQGIGLVKTAKDSRESQQWHCRFASFWVRLSARYSRATAAVPFLTQFLVL